MPLKPLNRVMLSMREREQEVDEGEGLRDCGHGGQVSKRNAGCRITLEFQIKKKPFLF